ncbi:MAG: hypothetical protein ABTD50_00140 [Polyangiaceae bacterium]|jgi:hypothetical protein
MPNAILDGLSLVDTVGHIILGTTLTCLALAICANLFVRARYVGLERDLRRNAESGHSFSHRVLNEIVGDVEDALRRATAVNTQAIIEDNFQAKLRPLLIAERFVKAATGLVIILGLLGTFYGLTLSVGRLVDLVSGDARAATDISQAMTSGLTHALMGMAVAFSNSLVGIGSAVVLTVLGVFSNATDRRIALMIQLEAYLERVLSNRDAGQGNAGIEQSIDGFREAATQFESSVALFASAFRELVASTDGLSEFNVRVVAAKPRDRG